MKKAVHTNRKTRIVSFILMLLMIFYIIPLSVLAETDFNNKAYVIDTENESQESAVSEVSEIVELREESSKHFRLQDGSFIAASYSRPVHYLDKNGVWQDIDNRLFETLSDYSTPSARIKFAKKITGSGELFTLKDGNKKISISLSGAIKKTVGEVTSDHGSDGNEDTELGKMLNLENLTSSIIYKDILEGVDLEYVVHSTNVKENIIVKERKESYTYSFGLKLNNLVAVLTDEGAIEIRDDGGEFAYVIPAPIVFDANRVCAPCEAAGFSLVSLGSGKYTLTVSVDEEWMNDEERAFPVTVDPTIGTDSNVLDLYVNKSAVNTSYSTSNYLYVSPNHNSYFKILELPTLPAGAYITDSSIKLRHSSGAAGAYVEAYLVMSNWDTTLTWNKTIASTPSGKIHPYPADYTKIEGAGLYYSWDITTLAKFWYSGGSNYGIAFKTNDSKTALFYSDNYTGTDAKPIFSVSYTSILGIEDYLTTSSQSAGLAGTGYVNHATGNLSFVTNTLSTTDYLLPFTLSLVYNSALANQHYVYQNANTSYNSPLSGYGFKLNIQETVIKKTVITPNDTASLYIYSDSDGTEHYFLYNSELGYYTDEDGMLLKMDISSTAVTITDRDQNVKTFEKQSYTLGEEVTDSFKLSKISDKNGNSVIIGYDTQGRPINVGLQPSGSNSTIVMLRLSYSSAGALYAIYNEASKEAVILRYSDTYSGATSATAYNYLREITFAHGTSEVVAPDWSAFYTSGTATNISSDATVSYTYDSLGRLTSAFDGLSSRTIAYTYSSGKVSLALETESNIDGQSVGFTYGDGFTNVRTSGSDDVYNTDDDVITRYVFDRLGRTVNYYSTNINGTYIYGSVSGKYEEQENVKNNIKETASVGGSGTNYILNGDFESGNSYWSLSSGVYRMAGFSGVGTGAYNLLLAPSSGSVASAAQYVALEEGDYTLSFIYNSSYNEDYTLSASVESLSDTSVIFQKDFAVDNAGATDNISASMHFSVGEGGDNFKVTVYVTAPSGSSGGEVYVDEIMIERGILNSSYNLVEMGHFESSNITSSGAASTLPSAVWQNQSGSGISVTEDEEPFGKVLSVTTAKGERRYAKQRIYTATDIELSNYDSNPQNVNNERDYLVSGFGKISLWNSAKADFSIKIEVSYYQRSGGDDVVVTHTFPFQDIISAWQFTSGSFSGVYVPPEGDTAEYGCIHYIDVICEYSYNYTGTAYFDNIAVTECTDNGITRYYYYENGNLLAEETFFNTVYYEYDSYNNLTRVASENGVLTDYTYDTNGVNLLKETRYDFVLTASGYPLYPFGAEDTDSLITKTKKSETVYSYNAYGLPTAVTTTEQTDGTKIYAAYTYDTSLSSRIFGALLTESDGGISAVKRYYYDADNGRLLAEVGQSGGMGTAYSYDGLGRLISAVPANYSSSTAYTAESGTEEVLYTYDSRGNLATITTDSTVYTLTYDSYRNPEAIKAGDNTLATYEYNPGNGKLVKVIYGNGFVEEYVYNSLEMLTEIWYTYASGEEVPAVSYTYNDDGQLHRVDDHINGRSSVYEYTPGGRLSCISEFETDEMFNKTALLFSYDGKGRLEQLLLSLDYAYGSYRNTEKIFNFYSYKDDGSLNHYSVLAGNSYLTEIDYYYDDFGRLSTVSGELDGWLELRREYDYRSVGNYTSSQVAAFRTLIDMTETEYLYTYDANGNITKITVDGDEIRYFYDNLGQLLREDNEVLNKTYVYTYDKAGNILTKKTYALTAASVTPTSPTSTVNYGYSSGEWGDLLTSYKGYSNYYDEIGNPTSYYNGTRYYFTWSGRQLTGASKGSVSYTFSYNDEGIRTSKTVGGVEHTYRLNGSQILSEEWDNKMISFVYDASGAPICMRYRETSYAADTWDLYWIETNMHGDVIAIYDNYADLLVSYTYDAWGNQTITYSNGGASTPAQYNPFRYRGYYYDIDLGLYYLNARYYDSNTGRFVNADTLISGANGSLYGYNLYVYCFNNPISLIDENGNWPKWMEKVKKWVKKQYLAWKEESFLYNVILDNISIDAGVGFGMGGEFELGPAKISGVSRMDIIGFEAHGFEGKFGHYGKSSFTASFGKFAIGETNKTFESFDGERTVQSKIVPEVEFSIGYEHGYVIVVHKNFSISFSGIFNDFIGYGRKYGWWR